MLSGDLPATARAGARGRGGGARGRAASSSSGPCCRCWPRPRRTSARRSAGFEEASVEWKLDGIRIQIHRRGDEVRIYTRNLNEITALLPGVAAAVRALAGRRSSCSTARRSRWARRARPPSRTPSRRSTPTRRRRASSRSCSTCSTSTARDLLDAPLRERRAALEAVAGGLAMPGVLDRRSRSRRSGCSTRRSPPGHEGVVVKDAASLYAAGRRGKAWRKVKPVRTYDLVVLGAEWGHGRRQGWLSNLHLGARDPDGGFVMVGKTLQGPDRRAARVADARAARARAGTARDRGARPARARGRDRDRRRAGLDPLPAAASRCASRA